MSGTRSNWWVAGTALLLALGGIGFVAWSLLPDASGARGPATEVESPHGWPRILVERYADGRRGRRVEVPAPPRRIVSATLATDEILMELVEPERIAALSNLAASRQSLVADRIGCIEHFVSADVESIIALRPDLCFLASYNREETRSLLLDSGIPVYVFRRFSSLADIRDNVRAMGQAVGAEEAASKLIREMNRKLASVSRRLPARDEWPSALAYAKSGWVAGRGTMEADIFHAAGLRHAAEEMNVVGYAQVTEEQVLKMAPDYFVVASSTDLDAPLQAWLSENPALAPLEAIRLQRFLVLDEALLSTASHHAAETVTELARQVYPDRFPDER